MTLIACNDFRLDSSTSVVLKLCLSSDSQTLGVLSIDEENQTELQIFEFQSAAPKGKFKAAQQKNFVFAKEFLIVCGAAGDLWGLSLQKFPHKILFHVQMANVEFCTVSVNSASNCIAVGTAQTDAIQNESGQTKNPNSANSGANRNSGASQNSGANDEENDDENDRQSCESDQAAHILFFDSTGTVLGSYGESQADSITALEFSMQNESETILACGCADGLLNVFDVRENSEDDALLYTFNAELGIAAIHFISNEEFLAICDSGDVSAWNFRSGDRVFSINNPVNQLTPEFYKFSLVDAFAAWNGGIYLVFTDDIGSMQIAAWNRLQCKLHLGASHGGNGGANVNQKSFAQPK